MGFVDQMQERGLVAQLTFEDEFKEHCGQPGRTAYVGFDPTADSLHVGHLLPVMMLSRWQKAGHRAIAVMGGGTVMVGDPTGKTEMRQMLQAEQIERNIENFKQQVKPLLDFSSEQNGLILNNADWLKGLNYLEFLREIGVHFSVNRMLTADCFKSRLEKGLSFLEFNYMLLQGYDFLYLHRHHDCTVQLGGDDQWSNILAGADLIRRKQDGAKAFCLTNPLLATSDGRKMGKTEKGAVWLDPEKTPPYDYFQFWRNIPDDMVEPCLRYFTFMDMAAIKDLTAEQGSAINAAKIELATAATAIVHGEEEAQKAKSATTSLFQGSGGAGNEPEKLLARSEMTPELSVIELLVKTEICPSKGEARRIVTQGGFSVDGEKIADPSHVLDAAKLEAPSGVLLRLGKKRYYRLRLQD